MIARRLPFVVLGAALIGVLVVADRDEPAAVARSTYGENALSQSTPALYSGDLLSTSWFCPGGPTVDGRSPSVTTFNSTADPPEVTNTADTDAGTNGFVAGDGVERLVAREGHLVGQSTTDCPLSP